MQHTQMCQVVYMSYTQALMAVEGCSFDPEAFDGDRSGNMFEEPGNLVWGESHFLHEGPDGTVGVAFGACFMTVDSAYQVSEVSGGDMLAIVDTACTKSVAGHDWFERYADWADNIARPESCRRPTSRRRRRTRPSRSGIWKRRLHPSRRSRTRRRGASECRREH